MKNDVSEDLLAVFPIEYTDWNGIQRIFFVFPDPVGIEFGKHRRDFKIRTRSAIDPSNIARFFQFELVERDDGWWRVDMIGQLSNYGEFESCGLPDEVILVIARRFCLLICGSSTEECQIVKARNVWERLQTRFNETPLDFKVEETEGRFWLKPVKGAAVAMNGQNYESPIDVLWPSLAEAMFSLAPERAAELRALIARYKVQIRLDRETHEMKFEGVDLFGGLGLVDVGLRGLERLWAQAFGAVYVYRQAQAVGFARPINLRGSDEGNSACDLMAWALEGEVHGSPASWPEDLPKPQGSPLNEQHKIANELFKGAIGFAVLHELGHIVCGHHGTNLSRDIFYRQEFEADEWAYDWLLKNWREQVNNQQVYIHRATLIASLFALIAISQVYKPRRVWESKHPNTIDRLLRFLLKHANEDFPFPVGLVWAVPGQILHLHLSQIQNAVIPPVNGWRTYLHVIRDAIDQHEQGSVRREFARAGSAGEEGGELSNGDAGGMNHE